MTLPQFLVLPSNLHGYLNRTYCHLRLPRLEYSIQWWVPLLTISDESDDNTESPVELLSDKVRISLVSSRVCSDGILSSRHLNKSVGATVEGQLKQRPGLYKSAGKVEQAGNGHNYLDIATEVLLRPKEHRSHSTPRETHATAV